MPVLKFDIDTNNNITLEKYTITDISDDKRSAFIDKQIFIQDCFKIDHDTYLVENNLFFKLAKFFEGNTIYTMLIRDGRNKIIIVPSRSYVFWKGRSVDPLEYKITQDESKISSIINMLKSITEKA